MVEGEDQNTVVKLAKELAEVVAEEVSAQPFIATI
jgi:hypothetical protein